jgi:hypothetical protein
LKLKVATFLRNTQDDLNSFGLFYTNGNVKIDDSCILENKATYTFNIYSSTMTLSNCTIDSTAKTGNLIIQNAATTSFIHALNHMSTLNCYSKYDAIGYLTPLKKQMPCFTFGNFFYQYQLRFFFSLLDAFLFNFIHLDVSSYPLY